MRAAKKTRPVSPGAKLKGGTSGISGITLKSDIVPDVRQTAVLWDAKVRYNIDIKDTKVSVFKH